MAESAIQVESVSKNFESVCALDGVSFDVPVASIFGLLGPNGAGKTTLVRVLSTLLHPDGGRARVMGYDVARHGDEVRYQIGLAGQNAAVDANLTGRENLTLVGRLAQMHKRDAQRRAADLLERFDLATAADRPVRTYSGGMRRRLDVAAALVHRPPVLFLDEPTTGLDIKSRLELWAVIRELVADGSTVLLTTQYLEEADQLADRIAVVDHGRLVANDTASSLKARLARTVIEIGMENDQAGEQAEAVLSGPISPLVTAHPEREGALVRLASRDGSSVLVDVLRSLDSEGLAPATLSVREPSLDDVFLALTGRHAFDESAENAAPAPSGRDYNPAGGEERP